MRYEEELSHDERALEGLLSELAPRTSGLNRDELMFNAGRRTVRRTAGVWKATSAVLGLVCVALSAFVYDGRPSLSVERGGLALTAAEGAGNRTTRATDTQGLKSERVQLPTAWPTSSGAPYLTQLDQLIRNGWDVLPSSRSVEPGRTPGLEFEWGERAGRTDALRLLGDWIFGGTQDGDRS